MAQTREQVVDTVIDGSRLRNVAHVSKRAHVHDIVCIGFGISALSLAIALEENHHNTDVLFLERQSRSTYVPSSRLPGQMMQLSFLNDLVTMENPRSKFSYTNYLHATDQLIQFTNLSSIQPLREQFTTYLHWCAEKFRTNVRYGSDVQVVRPVTSYGSLIDAWSVEYVDIESGRIQHVLARQVVCTGGPRPEIPVALANPEISSSVLHSSGCGDLLNTLRSLNSQRRIAVMGDGQEAAEIVESICEMSQRHRVTWIPGHSGKESAEIDTDLGHRLYERQYSQRVEDPDAQRWTFQTHKNVGLRFAYRDANGRIHLSYTGTDADSGSSGVVCDFIIAATGYKPWDHRRLLGPVKSFLTAGRFTVDQHHSVNLQKDCVQQDCGIWMLGRSSDAAKHGDKHLAQMATTSKCVAQSLVDQLRRRDTRWQQTQARL